MFLSPPEIRSIERWRWPRFSTIACMTGMYLALVEQLGCPLLTAEVRLLRQVRERGLANDVLLITDPIP